MQLGSAAAAGQAKLQSALCFTHKMHYDNYWLVVTDVCVAKLYDCNVGSVRG